MFSSSRRSVVKVYGLSSGEGGNRSGTGFVTTLAGKLSVVTNRHVVEKAEVVVIESVSGVWSTGDWKEHPSLDMALLPLPDAPVFGDDGPPPPLPVSSSTVLVPGRAVYTVGYPLGESLAVQQGIVSSTDGDELVFSAPLSSGASGSPLLDSDGRVVGLCHSFVPDAQNYNLALPSDFLFLPAEWKIRTASQDPSLGSYLKKIVEVKSLVQRSAAEWERVAEEFPEWGDWVAKTMLTRKPLLRAMESSVMAVHSMDWAAMSSPETARSNLMVALMIGKNASSLESAWTLHKSNLAASRAIQPAEVPWSAVSDMSLVPSLVEAGKSLSAEIVRAMDQPGKEETSQPRPSPPTGSPFAISIPAPPSVEASPSPADLLSALKAQLEAEGRWSAGGVP